MSKIWTGVRPDFRHFWNSNVRFSDTHCTIEFSLIKSILCCHTIIHHMYLFEVKAKRRISSSKRLIFIPHSRPKQFSRQEVCCNLIGHIKTGLVAPIRITKMFYFIANRSSLWESNFNLVIFCLCQSSQWLP